MIDEEVMYRLRCPGDDGSGDHNSLDLVGNEDSRASFADFLRTVEFYGARIGCEKCGCPLVLQGFDS